VPGLLADVPSAGPGIFAPLDRWITQDGAHFAYIAHYGYTDWWRTAFWPAYPALMHVLGPVVGGDYGLAGILVANAAFFAALVALRWLAERELGAAAARRAIFYLAIFPTAFYFFAPYSESLFLALSITSVAAMRQRRWWLAGLLGCAATLTRSAGVLLAVPFAVEFVLAYRGGAGRWWQAGYVALMPFAAVLYSAYLWLLGRPPLLYTTAEGYWGRSLQWPWTTFVLGVQALTQLHGKVGTSAAHFVLNFATLLLFIALTIAAFRVLPRTYGFYALALMLYLMIFPATDPLAAVQGDARLVLMIFPIFMAVGVWGRRTWLHEAVIYLMPPLLAIAATHYLLHLATS
jgi:Gpi18-like mannosyltransferase